MDPQKTPNSNNPEEKNPSNPNDEATNDVSMSEESSVTPGTVVVGGPANPDSDMGPKRPELSEPDSQIPATDASSAPTPEAPQESEPQMAAFMRDDAPVDTPPTPPKKKTGLIISIIAAVVLLVGGAAAYFMFMKPDPDKVLKTALVNTFSKDKVTSVGFEGGIVATDQESSVDVSFTFNGASSQTGQLNLAASFTVPMLEPVTLDVVSEDGQDYYAKVGGLESVLLLLGADEAAASYAPLLESVDNQWYVINQETVSQFAGGTVPTSTGLSDADRQKLADVYTQNEFLTVTETLKDEKIAGVDSYHYKVAVDAGKFKSFLTAIETAGIDMASLGLTQPLLESLKNGIDSSNLSNTPVDVWIAKDSKLFTQFVFSITADGVEMDIELTLKDYNKPVSVEIPTDTKPITELLTPFLTGASDLPLLQ